MLMPIWLDWMSILIPKVWTAQSRSEGTSYYFKKETKMLLTVMLTNVEFAILLICAFLGGWQVILMPFIEWMYAEIDETENPSKPW